MKRILKLSSLLVAAMLLLASCFIDINGGSYQSDDYIYVKGTAARNKDTGLYDFASARIEVDYSDITDKLEPVDPKNLVDTIEDNVLFRCPNTRFSFISYESTPEPGYVFDEWKVRKLSELVDTEEDWTYEYRTAREGIEEAERYLSERKTDGKGTIENRYSPTLERLDVDLLPYIYPEYNRAPVYLSLVEEAKLPEGVEHGKGDGSKDKPYSIDEFMTLNRDRQEINVIVKSTATPNTALSDFIANLDTDFYNLREIHIQDVSEQKITDSLVSLKNYDYVELKGIEFSGDMTLDSNSTTNWKFTDCTFNNMTVTTPNPVILHNCKFTYLHKYPDTDITLRNCDKSGRVIEVEEHNK